MESASLKINENFPLSSLSAPLSSLSPRTNSCNPAGGLGTSLAMAALEPWMTSPMTSGSAPLHGLPGFLASASAVYPSFLAMSAAAAATSASNNNNLPTLNLSSFTQNKVPLKTSSPSPVNGFSPAGLEESEKKSSSIVALRLKAKEHMDNMALTKSVVGQ